MLPRGLQNTRRIAVKRLFVGVVLWLTALGNSSTLSSVTLEPLVSILAAQGTQQDPATLTVYVTRTGEKYHRDGCRYLSRSKIAVSLKEAVARGFGPCSVCKPPRVQR